MNHDAYRKYRKQGLSAQLAYRWATESPPEHEWEGSDERRTATIEGFDIEVRAEADYDTDLSYLGEFVEAHRHWGEYSSEPFPSEPTPLGLPARHFAWQGHTQSDWGFFFPDYVEDHYKHLRTNGMAKQPAREETAEMVEKWVTQRRDIESYVVTVTASREGVELGSTVIGGVDCFEDSEQYILQTVEECGLVETVITEARETLAKLCPINSGGSA